MNYDLTKVQDVAVYLILVQIDFGCKGLNVQKYANSL